MEIYLFQSPANTQRNYSHGLSKCYHAGRPHSSPEALSANQKPCLEPHQKLKSTLYGNTTISFRVKSQRQDKPYPLQKKKHSTHKRL